MRLRSALIIDSFYEDGEDIRNLALSCSYQAKVGATYPGGEAYCDSRDWEAVRQDIIRELGVASVERMPEGKNFRQGKFRLALAEDEKTRPDGVHQDVQRYSGIVYLARDQDCRGGIGLYRCRITGETSMTRVWLQSVSDRTNVRVDDPRFPQTVRAYCNDWSNWQQIGELPMRFNRLIVLMARCFHASTGMFGTSANNGRLTQHFEMYL